MPDPRRPAQRTRRLALPVVAFCCAAAAPQVIVSSSQPAPETAAAARQRLARVPADQRSRADRALLAALDLALAIGRPDAEQRTAGLIDPIGYQTLPLAGELPERPAKPVPAKEVAARLAGRAPVDADRLLAGQFAVLAAEELAERFPAVARWKLPDDVVVALRPAADPRVGGWVRCEACVVVRLRGRRTTIIGGNVLEALGTAAAAPSALRGQPQGAGAAPPWAAGALRAGGRRPIGGAALAGVALGRAGGRADAGGWPAPRVAAAALRQGPRGACSGPR